MTEVTTEDSDHDIKKGGTMSEIDEANRLQGQQGIQEPLTGTVANIRYLC